MSSIYIESETSSPFEETHMCLARRRPLKLLYDPSTQFCHRVHHHDRSCFSTTISSRKSWKEILH